MPDKTLFDMSVDRLVAETRAPKPTPLAALIVGYAVAVSVGAPAVLGMAYLSIWACVHLVDLIADLF